MAVLHRFYCISWFLSATECCLFLTAQPSTASTQSTTPLPSGQTRPSTLSTPSTQSTKPPPSTTPQTSKTLPSTTQKITPPVQNNCPHRQFQCTNSQCIPGVLQCDGVNDCADKTDEANCRKCNIRKNSEK